ncbi:hypothetical protein [Psychromonas aquatilis]|uniref:Uncharacterized protein n=1 Tax=Psychromonas aquatilis TaxID=2005072 RepID=A0ABU9GRW2_9GAMM
MRIRTNKNENIVGLCDFKEDTYELMFETEKETSKFNVIPKNDRNTFRKKHGIEVVEITEKATDDFINKLCDDETFLGKYLISRFREKMEMVYEKRTHVSFKTMYVYEQYTDIDEDEDEDKDEYEYEYESELRDYQLKEKEKEKEKSNYFSENAIFFYPDCVNDKDISLDECNKRDSNEEVSIQAAAFIIWINVLEEARRIFGSGHLYYYYLNSILFNLNKYHFMMDKNGRAIFTKEEVDCIAKNLSDCFFKDQELDVIQI